GQDLLGDILGVGLLEAPPPAPAVDLGAVLPHKGAPGARVGGVLQEHQQDGAGPRGGITPHQSYSFGPENLTWIVGTAPRECKEKSGPRKPPRVGNAGDPNRPRPTPREASRDALPNTRPGGPDGVRPGCAQNFATRLLCSGPLRRK